MSGELTLHAKYQGHQQTLVVPLSLTVGALTARLLSAFDLSSCKLVGLVKGKLPEQEVTLASLHPPGATVKIMVIGVPRSTLAAMGERESVYEAERLEEADRAAAEARVRAAAEARQAEERDRWEAEEAVRRQEREEKRRRDQAAWEVRRRADEVAARERELQAEQDARNSFAIELQAFHNPLLDASQKLLLPPHALQDLVNAKVQFPLTFQLLKPESVAAVQAETAAAAAHHAAASASIASAASSSSLADESKMDTSESLSLTPPSASRRPPSPPIDPMAVPILSPLVAYYAVQDFTAPPSTVSVPASLLKALNATDGAKLRLTTVNLQKAKHITLQPLTAAWTKLPELERRALLEFQLRKHTFLVQDSLLTFSYHPHMPSFAFRVVETKPDAVVSITDADLSTEILPFEETTAMSDDTSAASSTSARSNSAAGGQSTDEIPKLGPDPVQGKLSKEGTARFQYDVTDPNMSVTIEVRCLAGDVDLYVLNAAADGSESDVGVAQFTWAAQSKGSKTLTLTARDPLFQTGTWQVLLRAYGGDGEFAVVVKEAPAKEAGASGGGYALGGSSSTSAPAAAPSADSQQCSNCKQWISSKAQLHSVQCARLNWPCGQCGLVVKTSEKEKHLALVHAQYTCLCGVQLDQPAMVAHRRDACSLRLTTCLYCPMKLVVAERGSHQAECGLLSSACPLCAQSVQRKVMRRHLVKTHGGVHGKTDEREILFSDFWQ